MATGGEGADLQIPFVWAEAYLVDWVLDQKEELIPEEACQEVARAFDQEMASDR